MSQITSPSTQSVHRGAAEISATSRVIICVHGICWRQRPGNGTNRIPLIEFLTYERKIGGRCPAQVFPGGRINLPIEEVASEGNPEGRLAHELLREWRVAVGGQLEKVGTPITLKESGCVHYFFPISPEDGGRGDLRATEITRPLLGTTVLETIGRPEWIIEPVLRSNNLPHKMGGVHLKAAAMTMRSISLRARHEE